MALLAPSSRHGTNGVTLDPYTLVDERRNIYHPGRPAKCVRRDLKGPNLCGTRGEEHREV